MLKDNRGDALLTMVLYSFIALIVVLLGLYGSRLYAEHYQQKIKEKAITLEEATEALQLSNNLTSLPITGEETIDVEVKSGDISKVKITPLFTTKKDAKESFKINTNTTPIEILDSPSETKFRSVTNTEVSSTRYSSYALFQDYDASQTLNKKVSPEVDKKEVLMNILATKGGKDEVVTLEGHDLFSTLEPTDPSLPETAYKVSVYLNGELVESKSFSGVSLSFNNELASVANEDIVTYEYINKRNQIIAIANVLKNPSSQLLATPYSNKTKNSESLQIVLNEGTKFQVDDSVSTKTKGSNNIKTNVDLYQNFSATYYSELVCEYKEVLTPIAYVNRNLTSGNAYPYTGNALASYTYDNWMPTDEHFKKTFNREPKRGSLDYDGDNSPNGVKPSPCGSPTLSKTSAYDGVFMWYHPLKKHQSFINGFNTISQNTLARFEGSKASGGGKTFTDNASATDTTNKYVYKYDSNVTSIPFKSKLYCSDYSIKVNNSTASNAALAYPQILSENQEWWNDKFSKYETYLQTELTKFNKVVQDIQWANGIAGRPVDQGVPTWNANGEHDFEPWMVANGHYQNVNGKLVADTKVPCISDIGRNQVHYQYKPRLDSYSEINYNLINNVDSEYTVVLKGKINQNFLKEIDVYEQNKVYYPTVNGSSSLTKDRHLNAYSALTERNAVKGWLERFTTNRARVYISKNNNSIYEKGDNTVDTSKGFYIELTPEESSFSDIVDQNTGEFELTYKFKLGPNYTNASLKSLHEDLSNASDFTQVRFYSYLGNAFLTDMTIESEVLEAAYYKLTSLDDEGKTLREDYVEVSQ